MKIQRERRQCPQEISFDQVAAENDTDIVDFLLYKVDSFFRVQTFWTTDKHVSSSKGGSKRQFTEGGSLDLQAIVKVQVKICSIVVADIGWGLWHYRLTFHHYNSKIGIELQQL
jgi:hypothetical protein